MDLGLRGKTAVVTGAGRGIGLAIARTLLDEGMRVYGAARSPAPELTEAGAHALRVDLTSPEGPEQFIGAAEREFGTIDVLVNNVGGGDGPDFTVSGFLTEDDESWRRAWELNLMAAVRTTRACLPALLAQGSGVIVNISSSGARTPGVPVAYNTAKAALTALGKALSEEFGPRGLRVNTVSPGPTRTSLWEGSDRFGARLAEAAGARQDELPAFLDQVPEFLRMTTGRFTEPEEVGALVAHLCSPRSGNLTGADILLDGGSVKTV